MLHGQGEKYLTDDFGHEAEISLGTLSLIGQESKIILMLPDHDMTWIAES